VRQNQNYELVSQAFYQNFNFLPDRYLSGLQHFQHSINKHFDFGYNYYMPFDHFISFSGKKDHLAVQVVEWYSNRWSYYLVSNNVH